MSFRTVAREWPLATFLVLTYALSWAASVPLIGHAQGFSHWEPPAWWDSVMAFGPAIAAVLVVAARDGSAGLRAFLANCFNPRLPPLAWVYAVVAPIAIFGASFAISRYLNGAWPVLKSADSAAAVGTASSAWLIAALYGALSGPGEEPGWRGFALPRLLDSAGRWRATLLLTAMWVPWHLPMFFYREGFGIGNFAAFGFALLFGAIWLTEIHILARGIAFAAVAWHAVWNFVAITARAHTPSPFMIMTSFILLGAILIGVKWILEDRARARRSAPASTRFESSPHRDRA